MPSKSKVAREEQNIYWKNKLDQRLSVLSEKGIEPKKIAVDTAVRKIRAKLRDTEGRLRVISSMEKKVEEMAGIKAQKLAAPKDTKSGKKKGKENSKKKAKRAESVSLMQCLQRLKR